MRATQREAGGTSPPGAGPGGERGGPRVFPEDFRCTGDVLTVWESRGTVSPPPPPRPPEPCWFLSPRTLPCPPSPPPSVQCEVSEPGPRTQKQVQDEAFPPASFCPEEARTSQPKLPHLSNAHHTARLREATAGAAQSTVLCSLLSMGYGLPATADRRDTAHLSPGSPIASCPGTRRGTWGRKAVVSEAWRELQ